MPYQLLTSAPDTSLLQAAPSGYLLILSFEIVLRVEGEIGLLLSHQSYRPDPEGGYSTGVLSPPFVGLALSTDELFSDNVKSIRRRFEDFEKKFDVERQVRIVLYAMGLTNYEFERAGEIIELKQSNRELGKYKCYKVLRFSVTSNTRLCVLNLVDPLVLSG